MSRKIVCFRRLYRRYKVLHIRLLSVLCVLMLITFLVYKTFVSRRFHSGTLERVFRNKNVVYPFAIDYKRKDWHDYEFVEYEKSRSGPGEHGIAHFLTDPDDIARNEEIFNTHGLFGLVSDQISVNRSLPDTRVPQCKNIKYLEKLPKISVIIIFHNEYLSALKRTLHALKNRTPPELLIEILLVNDASTLSEMYEPLQSYIHETFEGLVRIIDLKERSGLIRARMEGARQAIGEVLVFFDAHTEVNTNWLPPLLEPIAIEPKTVTTPHTDNFSSKTFGYPTKYNRRTRGIFSWDFEYRWMPRLEKDEVNREKPTDLPVMLGCGFAIRKDYFFDIGGYDEGLMIWNGEHYELSIKLWLCGGRLLEVPCSRLGHTFRWHSQSHVLKDFDFIAYNFKRIAEVWLDDFKQYLYKTDPQRYNKIDPGDLTVAKSVRKLLNCKPFHYFVDQIVPDMLVRYPFEDPGVFAKGAIQSEADRKLCVDNTLKTPQDFPRLFTCHNNLSSPGNSQEFSLSQLRHICTGRRSDLCLNGGKDVTITNCHFEYGNQFWFYHHITHQIINPPTNNCLTAVLSDNSLTSTRCDLENVNQKWTWGFTNVSALQNWETFGIKLPDVGFNFTR